MPKTNLPPDLHTSSAVSPLAAFANTRCKVPVAEKNSNVSGTLSPRGMFLSKLANEVKVRIVNTNHI